MAVPARWDPSSPRFVGAVLATLVGLVAVASVLGGIGWPGRFTGLLAGGLVALGLYLVAIVIGVSVRRGNRYRLVMVWLFLLQMVVWLGTAFALVRGRVDIVGFVVGVSLLPLAILATLCWYTLQKQRTPSERRVG